MYEEERVVVEWDGDTAGKYVYNDDWVKVAELGTLNARSLYWAEVTITKPDGTQATTVINPQSVSVDDDDGNKYAYWGDDSAITNETEMVRLCYEENSYCEQSGLFICQTEGEGYISKLVFHMTKEMPE